MKLLYFSWVREQVGVDSEDVSPPAAVGDVGGLVAWLRKRSDGHAAALADLARVRVAVNQEAVGPEHPLGPGDEVAFFPPMTGG